MVFSRKSTSVGEQEVKGKRYEKLEKWHRIAIAIENT